MDEKIKVYGKAQNRTALGIFNAYMVMHPDATMADLRKAFPNSLNPDSGVSEIFIRPASNHPGSVDHYFDHADELITDGDGKKVAVVNMWTKDSYRRLVDWAKRYGIVVAEFVPADKIGIGKKGEYELEYLNDYVPPVKKDKVEKVAAAAPVVPEPDPVEEEIEEAPKKRRGCLWWLLALLLCAFIVFLVLWLCRACGHKAVNDAETVTTEIVAATGLDSLGVSGDSTGVTAGVSDEVASQLAEYQADFNAIEKYPENGSQLNAQGKAILDKVAALMKANPGLNIDVVGHTSADGSASYNQTLSEKRAANVVSYLESKGISASRLVSQGVGETNLIDPANPNSQANRCVVFTVDK